MDFFEEYHNIREAGYSVEDAEKIIDAQKEIHVKTAAGGLIGPRGPVAGPTTSSPAAPIKKAPSVVNTPKPSAQTTRPITDLTPRQQYTIQTIRRIGEQVGATPAQIEAAIAVTGGESNFGQQPFQIGGPAVGAFQFDPGGELRPLLNRGMTPAQVANDPALEAKIFFERTDPYTKEMTPSEAQQYDVLNFERPASPTNDLNPTHLTEANKFISEVSGEKALPTSSLGITSPEMANYQSGGGVGGNSGQTSTSTTPYSAPASNTMAVNPTLTSTLFPSLLGPMGPTNLNSSNVSGLPSNSTQKIPQSNLSGFPTGTEQTGIAQGVRTAAKGLVSPSGPVNNAPFPEGHPLHPANPNHPLKQLVTHAATSLAGAKVSPTDQYQNNAVTEGLALRGIPYVWGGTDPRTGLDCSGFVQYSWKKAGINIPRTTQQQLADKSLQPVPLNPKLWHPGDLIYTEGGDHVGMYLGNGEVESAPHTGANVSITPVGDYWANAVAVRRPPLPDNAASLASIPVDKNLAQMAMGQGPGGYGVSPGAAEEMMQGSNASLIPASFNNVPLTSTTPINTTPLDTGGLTSMSPMLGMLPPAANVPLRNNNQLLVPFNNQQTTNQNINNGWIPGQGFVSTPKTSKNSIHEELTFLTAEPEEPPKDGIVEEGEPGTLRTSYNSIHEELFKDSAAGDPVSALLSTSVSPPSSSTTPDTTIITPSASDTAPTRITTPADNPENPKPGVKEGLKQFGEGFERANKAIETRITNPVKSYLNNLAVTGLPNDVFFSDLKDAFSSSGAATQKVIQSYTTNNTLPPTLAAYIPGYKQMPPEQLQKEIERLMGNSSIREKVFMEMQSMIKTTASVKKPYQAVWEYLAKIRKQDRDFAKNNYELNMKNANKIDPETLNNSVIEEFYHLIGEGNIEEAFTVLDKVSDPNLQNRVLQKYLERVS